MSATHKPTVALLIETSRAYGREICLGVADYARNHGEWNFILREGDLDAGMPKWFKDWKGDGIICRLSNPELADVLGEARCPVIDTYGHIRHPSIPFIDTDADAVGAMAANFFVDAAFTSFAYCGYSNIKFSDERSEAFRRALGKQSSGLMVYRSPIERNSPDVTEREGQYPGGSPELVAWVASLPPHTAILACNDVRAQQLLNAAAQAGRIVPDDLAVMGVDDDQVLCELSNPRLSSIHPDARSIGYTAAHWLDAKMKGESVKYRELLIPPLRVVERSSTDIIASEDEIFVTSLRFIRDHISDGIDVNAVVDHAGRSRSYVDSRFRKILGRSVKEEIDRVRIAKSAILLSETSRSLGQIATDCGFATASHFSRIFKATHGITPGAYRTTHLRR